jgi:hypothetical protein
MFDLTQHIANSRQEQARRYIVIAAEMILQCPDERKRWRAMAELRKLQKIAKHG